jgi:hypothetical protein
MIVFVSYSPGQSRGRCGGVGTGEQRAALLEVARGVKGQRADWGDSITKAISACKLVILVFSGHSNESKRVRDEIYYVISEEKIILPFRIENLDPTGSMRLHLSSRHWLDAYQPSWQAHLNRLVGSAADSLGREPVVLAAREETPQPAVGAPATMLVARPPKRKSRAPPKPWQGWPATSQAVTGAGSPPAHAGSEAGRPPDMGVDRCRAGTSSDPCTGRWRSLARARWTAPPCDAD